MSEQERERLQKEADVEGHRLQKAQAEERAEEDAGPREGEEPDVEGHRLQK